MNTNMPQNGRTKLVPPSTETKNQVLETLEESNQSEQTEEPELTELDNEIECARCHELMELHSDFDKLMYSCDSCNFVLRCV